MHLQIMIRGINTQCELWKILAQGQFLKWVRTDVETGEEFEVLFQMALRPSVLGTWELIFPEECLATVLSMLGIVNKESGIYGNISLKGARMAVLRKCCGVKKIPKKALKEAAEIPNSIVLSNSQRGLSNLIVNGVAIHPIGIRKDERRETEGEGEWAGKMVLQEML